MKFVLFTQITNGEGMAGIDNLKNRFTNQSPLVWVAAVTALVNGILLIYGSPFLKVFQLYLTLALASSYIAVTLLKRSKKLLENKIFLLSVATFLASLPTLVNDLMVIAAKFPIFFSTLTILHSGLTLLVAASYIALACGFYWGMKGSSEKTSQLADNALAKKTLQSHEEESLPDQPQPLPENTFVQQTDKIKALLNVLPEDSSEEEEENPLNDVTVDFAEDEPEAVNAGAISMIFSRRLLQQEGGGELMQNELQRGSAIRADTPVCYIENIAERVKKHPRNIESIAERVKNSPRNRKKMTPCKLHSNC